MSDPPEAPTHSRRLCGGRLAVNRCPFLVVVAVAAAVTSVAALYFNFWSALAGGIPHRFATQADIIRHGFDATRTSDTSTLTYPMWGYGWLNLITENRIVLMSGQLALAVVASVLFIGALHGKMSDGALRFTGLLTAVMLPWYCLHATITLYSPAAALLVAAIALLILAVSDSRRAIRLAAGSGILFGLCLNFRSDFLMMPVGLAVLIVGCQRTVASWKLVSVWAASIAAMMLPWIIYTKHVAAKPRITSTNGGHALFVGLGQLPNNVWGITPSDTDPLMRRIIDRELGPDESTLGLRADAVLKREFFKRVREHPGEFARKIAYSGIKIVVQGAYPGEFLNTASNRVRKTELVQQAKALVRRPGNFLREHGVGRSFRLFLIMACYGTTILVVLGSFLVLPLNAWVGLSRGHLPMLLVIACIAYHWLLQAAVFNLPPYTSSHLLFHIANLGFAGDSWMALRVARQA